MIYFSICVIIHFIRFADDCWLNVRGKSEHHRAGCLLTAGGGDPKESATENKQHDFSAIGEMVV